MAFGLESQRLWQTAAQTATPGMSPVVFVAGAWTAGVGPAVPAYQTFLQRITQPQAEDRERQVIQRLAFSSVIAPQAEELLDPVMAVHAFEKIPSVNDPEIAVWIDFLAQRQQAYLTLEVRGASRSELKDLESSLSQAIRQRRRQEGIDAKGVHVRVIPMETVRNGFKPFPTSHFNSNAEGALRLVYGRDRGRLAQIAAKTKALLVADDLDEQTAKLKKAAALAATLDALLTGRARPGAVILSAAQFLSERAGLLRQLEAMVERSA